MAAEVEALQLPVNPEADDLIHIRLRCEQCKGNPPRENRPNEIEMTIHKYQLATVTIWFHSFHEGHYFSYWEDGELVLGDG